MTSPTPLAARLAAEIGMLNAALEGDPDPDDSDVLMLEPAEIERLRNLMVEAREAQLAAVAWRAWVASKDIHLRADALTDEQLRHAFDVGEAESRRLTNDRIDTLQRELGAQAEDLERRTSPPRPDHVESLLATLHQRSEVVAHLPHQLLEAALRDEVATERRLAHAAAEGHDHVRGILLEIAAVFGRVDDLDTLPARVREAAIRGPS